MSNSHINKLKSGVIGSGGVEKKTITCMPLFFPYNNM